jgi:molybdate transport system ATP-binding protein
MKTYELSNGIMLDEENINDSGAFETAVQWANWNVSTVFTPDENNPGTADNAVALFERVYAKREYWLMTAYYRLKVMLIDRMMIEDYDGQVIMVSHSRDELYRFSEELFVLDAGRIIRHGAAKDVFSDPGCAAAARLTGCKNISAVDLMDDHTALARDWGMTLKTKRAIPSGTKYIGYRAHSFEAVWGEEQDNCVRFDLVRSDDLPFEKNLYIRTQAADPGSLICWFIQGDEQKEIAKRGYPDYLKMKEENMLFLK